MNWQKTRLGNIITTKKGFAFKSAKYVDSGVPIVRVSDFTSDSISEGDLKYYPKEEAQNYLDYELHYKDIIIQTVGSWPNNPASVVGKVVRVPYILDKSLLNQNAVKIVPKNNIDNDFLYYRLKSRDFDGHVIGQARGAANQASITLETIRSFKMSIPDYSEQIRLGKILTQYDDLIANNNKRIKILEKMAENLYKEWFVRFRFPGYETAEFVDGVPKGWKKMNLFDVASVCYGYTFSSDLFCDDKTLYPVVRIRDIVNNYTNTFTSEECDKKHIIENNSILVGMDGIFHTRLWTGGRAFLNQRVVKLNSIIDKLSNYQLYHAVYPQIKFLEQTISGTTVAHLGDKHLKKMSIFMPDERTLNKAFDIFENLLEQQYTLHKQNQNLIKQRDYLLPRLMSGKLQVK